jgi:ribosome-associated protein
LNSAVNISIIIAAMETVEVARRVVDAALSKQAADILLLDLRETSAFTDYFVICCGESERQVQAICNEIDKILGSEGISPHRREGDSDSGWVLLDFGDIVVHIFTPQQREYYELEGLWSAATAVVRLL